MKNILVIFICICCFNLASCSSKVSDKYSYHDFRTNKTLTFDFNERSFTNGHVSMDIFICPENLEFKCVIGGPAFVVPRVFEPARKEWEFDKYKFINKGAKNIKLLGKKYKVYRIEHFENEGWLWYLYSTKNGVLALGSRDKDNIQNVYFLEGSCGLGANTKC